jgi:hypothetical protein
MRDSRRNVVLLTSLLVIVFLGWFSWMTYSQSRTQWIESKVRQAMATSIESLAPQWPRIEYHDSVSGDPYYAPDIYDQAQVFGLYRHMLEQLNQDESVPPLKVFRVSISKAIGTAEDTVIIQAYMEFPLIGGIEKEIVVQSDGVKVPHYKTRG